MVTAGTAIDNVRMAVVHEEIHHVRITSGGQVSVPAAVRRRWGTRRVKITDVGDQLIVEPEPENRFATFRGTISGLPLTADEMLVQSRADEERIEGDGDLHAVARAVGIRTTPIPNSHGVRPA